MPDGEKKKLTFTTPFGITFEITDTEAWVKSYGDVALSDLADVGNPINEPGVLAELVDGGVIRPMTARDAAMFQAMQPETGPANVARGTPVTTPPPEVPGVTAPIPAGTTGGVGAPVASALSGEPQLETYLRMTRAGENLAEENLDEEFDAYIGQVFDRSEWDDVRTHKDDTITMYRAAQAQGRAVGTFKDFLRTIPLGYLRTLVEEKPEKHIPHDQAKYDFNTYVMQNYPDVAPLLMKGGLFDQLYSLYRQLNPLISFRKYIEMAPATLWEAELESIDAQIAKAEGKEALKPTPVRGAANVPTLMDRALMPFMVGMTEEMRGEFSEAVDTYVFGKRDKNGNKVIPGMWDYYYIANPELEALRQKDETAYNQAFAEWMQGNVPLRQLSQVAQRNVMMANPAIKNSLDYVSRVAYAMPRKYKTSYIDPATGDTVETEVELPPVADDKQDPFMLYDMALKELQGEGLSVPTMDEVNERAVRLAQGYVQTRLKDWPQDILPPELRVTGEPGKPAPVVGPKGEFIPAGQPANVYGGQVLPWAGTGYTSKQTPRPQALTAYQAWLGKTFEVPAVKKLQSWFSPVYSDYLGSGEGVPFGNYVENLGRNFFEGFLTPEEQGKRRYQPVVYR